MIHITIKRKGQEPRPRRCHADATLFTCPFCTTDACKPRQYHQIMTHIAGHKLRAVEYGDHVIYSCNIGCDKKAKHFHCCKCPKTYINKGAMKKHLCSVHPIATCTPDPQPVKHPLQEPPSEQHAPSSQQKLASHPSSEPSSQQKPASHPPPEPLSQQKPASHPSSEPSSQQKPASHPPPEPLSQQQPSSHPSPEPPSQQQAASQPLQEPLSQQQPASHPSSEPLSQQIPASHPSSEPPSQQKPASHPSPEPPSQQKPASHPPPEPLSQQKPASHPSTEPPLQQQPASQPKELDLQQAAPPAIERTQSSVQCPSRHITIKLKGQEPRPRRCRIDATLFTCPFCTTDVCKPRQYHQIMTHIAGHKLRAVEYGDHVIYSCNIGCGKKARHFHCCKCPKTYFNKGAIKKHLGSAHPITTCTPEPQPVSPPEPPSQQQPASQPKELDLQQAAPPAIERTQSSVQCPSWHITIKLKGQEPRPRRCRIDATLFTCPFCTTDVCKPRQYHQIMTHIAGHKLRAVEYGDHVIYSCNIGCGKKARHFHCCKCPKTYFNKGAIKKHLGSAHPITTCTPEPQPVSPPEPPSQQQPAPHPPPEPSSEKQPASHPPSEPPSNKQLASHSKELNLQQAAPHPQELTASPATKKNNVSVQCPQRHITVKQKGQEPRPQRYHADATLFTCPFCTTDVCKPRQYHQIMTHIAGHKLRAVEYGDFVMYSCNIGCGTKKAKHFHCCRCPKTYTSKSDLKRHLCSAHPISPETQPCPLAVAAHPVIAIRKQISVQCPHCGLSLNSKNLKKHIERKHLEASHPTPSVLPAQSVDKKNGLYVVSESFFEPYTPIHVVKRFWGSSHKIMCELDECNRQVEMAQSSEVFATQCVHLSSVDYTYAIAPSEDLSEHVLTEMVKRKWIGDVRKKRCLKLQNLAKSKGATFTSLVTIGGPDYMYYISIYEPKVSQYSKLGRILVKYNAKTDTLNCPCTKGRQSCLHNSIAKWCLYQMKKQLFENHPEAEEDIEPAT